MDALRLSLWIFIDVLFRFLRIITKILSLLFLRSGATVKQQNQNVEYFQKKKKKKKNEKKMVIEV